MSEEKKVEESTPKAEGDEAEAVDETVEMEEEAPAEGDEDADPKPE